MFQLARTGRENLRSMKKSSFAIRVDSVGKRFVHQVKSELDKNHNIKDNTFNLTGEGQIYETKTPSCPVNSFEKYIDYLHPYSGKTNSKTKIYNVILQHT